MVYEIPGLSAELSAQPGPDELLLWHTATTESPVQEGSYMRYIYQ